jgi:hypothetical protein
LCWMENERNVVDGKQNNGNLERAIVAGPE